MISLRAFAAVVGFTLLAGCGGDSTGPSNGGGGGGGSTSNAITVGNNFFDPNATTVPAGTTVTWTWDGGSSHNVTFNDGTHSATQSNGTYSRTFNTAGTYDYHCTVHGAAMSGTVVVQ